MFANYDVFPTFAELLGIDMPPGKDGVSLLPLWRGREPAQEHDAIVYASFFWGPSPVTADDWKLRRINKLDRFQLYYLPDDYQEAHDLAAQYPERVDAPAARMLEACDGSYENGCISTHFAQYDHEVVSEYLGTCHR